MILRCSCWIQNQAVLSFVHFPPRSSSTDTPKCQDITKDRQVGWLEGANERLKTSFEKFKRVYNTSKGREREVREGIDTK